MSSDSSTLNQNYLSYLNFLSQAKSTGSFKKYDIPLVYFLVLLLNHKKSPSDKLTLAQNYHELTPTTKLSAKMLRQFYEIISENKLLEFYMIDVKSSDVSGERIGFKVLRTIPEEKPCEGNLGLATGSPTVLGTPPQCVRPSSLVISPTSPSLIASFSELSIANNNPTEAPLIPTPYGPITKSDQITAQALAQFEIDLDKNYENFKHLKLCFLVTPIVCKCFGPKCFGNCVKCFKPKHFEKIQCTLGFYQSTSKHFEVLWLS